MTRSATIPHSDIGLRRDGAGDRAIVFMHGFLDDQHVWDPVIAELTASGFEIGRLDLAGFGERSEATGPFTFDRFAADLSAVVDAVDKPFVLVGHSMAAPIVELVAAGRPDRALGLLLVSPIPMAGTRLPDEAFEPFRSLGELGSREYRAFRQQVAPLTPDAELERLVSLAANFHAEVVRSVADLWNNGYPAGERPSGFAGPVLVLRGADDPLLTAEIVSARVAERFDTTRTTVTGIENSGHWPHIERPSAVAAAMNRFLADNIAPRATSTVAKNG